MAVEIIVRGVQPGDAARLARRLRAQDREELAALGSEPLEALERSARYSTRCNTVTVNGVVACMLGVAPVSIMSNVGAPWMLGSDLVTQYPLALGRRTGGYIRGMLDLYPVLRNHVHAKNTVAVHWLQRVGFLLQTPVVLPNGEVFYPFEMKASHV